MLNIFKKKGTVISDTEMAELLGLLDTTVREMIWFEIENEGQQKIRDYLAQQLYGLSKDLHNKWTT